MSEQEPLMLEMEGLVSERLVYGDQPHELSVTYLNPFYEGQIRQTYNQDAKVELADSLLENNMLHPLTVAELDVLETIEYVNDINELWSANYSIDNLTPNQNGEYFIVIAGHRRLLSIYYNNERSGVDDEQVSALCNIRQGIGLTEALRLQFTENAGRAEISQSRDALAIRMYFMRRSREMEDAEQGRFSYARCARELGVSWQAVKSAEDYFTLPVKTREDVDAGIYGYNWVLHLLEFHEALKAAHPDWDEEARGDELNSVLIKSRDGKFSAKVFDKHLEDRVEGLSYEQRQLVMSEQTDTPRKRADRAAESLIINATEDVRIALGHLSLAHIDDFREHPVVQRQVGEIGQIINQLRAEKP